MSKLFGKKELVDAMAAKGLALSKSDIKSVLEALVDVASDALFSGSSLRISDFLSAKMVKRAARKGRNPKTGAEIKIPAKEVIKVKSLMKKAAPKGKKK